MLLRDVNLAPRPDRCRPAKVGCYEWKNLRIILRGHLRSRWPYRPQIVRLLFLSLRNLLGAGGVVLLLLSGLRLYLFLRRVLVRGFRRFVPHDRRVRSTTTGVKPEAGGRWSSATFSTHGSSQS